MQIDINKQEQEQLMACIESAIKHAPSSLQAASMLLPLAQKISEAKEPDVPSD